MLEPSLHRRRHTVLDVSCRVGLLDFLVFFARGRQIYHGRTTRIFRVMSLVVSQDVTGLNTSAQFIARVLGFTAVGRAIKSRMWAVVTLCAVACDGCKLCMLKLFVARRRIYTVVHKNVVVSLNCITDYRFG